MRFLFAWVVGVALVVSTLAGCASAPPPADWQLNAKGALERAASAYLAGNGRVEAVEFERARAEVARTGRADLLATVVLTRCAWRVASLVIEDCTGFTPLAADAGPAARAYADYLAGRGQPADAALLPAQHQPFAAGNVSAGALAGIADPLARLVAAGVALQRNRAEPAVLASAVDTASAQGWSRPLLAWLNAQRLRAEAANDAEEAARLQRRIALVLEKP